MTGDGDRRRAILITLLGVIILMANNGLIIAGLTPFDGAIVADLNISVTALKLRDTVMIVTLGFTVPIAGYFLDHVPAKAVIVAGLAAMALGLGAYRYVHHLADIYAIHVLLGMSQATCGLVSHIVLVSRWTRRFRGLALGAIVAGSSIGNGLMPMFNAWLGTMIGWRDAISIGALIAAALIPVVWIVDKDRPARAGSGVTIAVTATASAVSFRQVMLSGNFWLLSIAAATTSFCILGLATSLVLYVQRDLHRPLQMATELLLLMFFAATIAQLVAGFAAGRFGAARVHLVVLVVLLSGTVLLNVPQPALILPALLLFGAGWGGNASLLQIRPVTLFAGPALGRALAGLAVLETFGACIASPVMGLLYETTGHYRPGFALIAAVAFAALICVTKIQGPCGTKASDSTLQLEGV